LRLYAKSDKEPDIITSNLKQRTYPIHGDQMPEKKRYLKNKDGKFKGSLPSAPNIAQPQDNPVVPSAAAASNPKSATSSSPATSGYNFGYREMEEASLRRIPKFDEMGTHEEMQKKLIEFRRAEPDPSLLSTESLPEVIIGTELSEPGYATVYGSRQHKTYSAMVRLNDETGEFEVSVNNNVFNSDTELISASFTSEEEAKEFAKENLTHHLQMVSKFRAAMNNDSNTLLATIESELISDGYLKLAPLEQEDKFFALASGKIPIRDCEFEFEFGRGLNRSVTVSKKNSDGTVSTYDYAANDLERVVLFGLYIAMHD
jgi:hypothetical protein